MEEMGSIGTGAGLAAMGFWLFIAIVATGGVWDKIRKRDAQHETLRRAIESGQSIDDALTDKLLIMGGDSKDLDRDLKVGGLITLCLAPGLALMGWIMSLTLAEELFVILLGVAALLAFISAGLLLASAVVNRWYSDPTSKRAPSA